jgi:hypothetical protein
MNTARDYADSGFDIQSAMVDQVQRFPRKEDRPEFLCGMAYM